MFVAGDLGREGAREHMPSVERYIDLTRTRVVVQRLFAIGTAVVAILILIGLPEARTAVTFWAGCALVVVAMLATLALSPVPFAHPAWMLVPVLDLLAVALLRAELLPHMANLSILLVIPALWLGIERGRLGVVVSGIGGLVVFLMPAVDGIAVLGSTADVSRLLLQELQTAGLALFGHLAALELRSRGRRLDAELRLSRRRELMSRAVLNGVGSGVVVYDAAGRVISANAQARTIAETGGYDLEHPEVAGSQVWQQDGSDPVPVPGERQALVRALDVEHLADTLEWLGPQHDLTPVGWNARRMYDEGTLLGTVVVCHDLTSSFSARRSQEQFLGTVTHELRTPLTSIVGFVDVVESLAAQEEDALLRRSLEAIRRNSEELDARVAQLLTLADSRPELRVERRDLGELVLAALDRWWARCDDLGLSLTGSVDSVVEVDVDPHQLRRVVDALLSNSSKFTPPGGDVRVRVVTSERVAVLVVSDTGIGMTDHDRERVFDRFHRGDAARVGAVRGMGVGLQSTKRIVEAHGGTVVIASESDIGTTVTVRLPMVLTESPAPA